jgi:hypothetical protein
VYPNTGTTNDGGIVMVGGPQCSDCRYHIWLLLGIMDIRVGADPMEFIHDRTNLASTDLAPSARLIRVRTARS